MKTIENQQVSVAMSLSRLLLRVLSDGSQVASGAAQVLDAQLSELRRMSVNSLVRAAVSSSSPRRPRPDPERKNPAGVSDTTEPETADLPDKPTKLPSAGGSTVPRDGNANYSDNVTASAHEISNPTQFEFKSGSAATRARQTHEHEDIVDENAERPLSSALSFTESDGHERFSSNSTRASNLDSSAIGSEATQQWLARERSVPESPFARVMNFGMLGAGLAFGAAAESIRRATGLGSATRPADTSQSYSAFVSEANAHRLASSLSRMRGAALKLGQMLSIQDERILPVPLQRALERVRQGADIMPRSQLTQVLRDKYAVSGENEDEQWMRRLGIDEFDFKPVAAASIGQVHRGKVKNADGGIAEICFKIQYPGVARSINSDIQNLKRLVSATGLLPDKLYVDEALAAAKEELERECDYRQEAANQTKFRELIETLPENENVYYVPAIFPSLSSSTILVSEYIHGVPIDKVEDPDVKSWIANAMLRLTLAELFKFRYMQTDPNPSNFMFGKTSDGERCLYLVDFGAARSYSDTFVEAYFDLICACAERDRDGIIAKSTELGFLTGEETKIMLDAHYQASIAVGEPFNKQFKGGYNFAANDIPGRTARFGRIMLEHRLKAPPKEAYSLHRRLSGAFLTAMRLGATIDCASMLEELKVYMSRRRQMATANDGIVVEGSTEAHEGHAIAS